MSILEYKKIVFKERKMSFLAWEDLYDDYTTSQYVKEDERYSLIRGHIDELILELYNPITMDSEYVHYLLGAIAKEVDIDMPCFKPINKVS